MSDKISTSLLLELRAEGKNCGEIGRIVGMKQRSVWARLRNAYRPALPNRGQFPAKHAPIVLGEKFGLWTVLAKGSFRHNQQRWHVVCACGTAAEVAQQHLRGGQSTRCIKCNGKRNSLAALERNRGRYCSNRRVPRVQEDLKIIFEKQHGLCALCLRKFDSLEDAAWDHDHGTGYGRGLLHRGCNVFLGFAERDPEILERARQYLAEHSRV